MANATQTTFQKDKFNWDGMYLTYEGKQGLTRNYEQDYPNCHPTRVGQPQDIFIARFKYGRKPYRQWINFICKNFTLEEWVANYNENKAPYEIMRARGYKGK